MTPINDNIIDRDVLQEAYIESIVDGMDIHSLYQFVYDTLNDKMDKYNVDELIEEVDRHNPELLNDTYTNTNLEAVTDYGVGK